MIKIYHNPRCTKSREGLALIEASKRPFEIVKYLEEIPSEKELRALIKKLGITPAELIRKNEAVWKENYKSKTLSDEAVIKAMIKYPKLIERPIVVNGSKAVIGRPSTKILNII